MRYIMISACLALLAGAGLAEPTATERRSPAASHERSIAVMSFNIRYDNPSDGPNAWPHRVDWVAEIIRENADIVGMQEVEKGQLDDLKQRLPEYSFYGVGRKDGKQGGEYVPIAWRNDRFALVEKGEFWLSETPDVPSKSWDSSLNRLTTWVRLKAEDSGQAILFVNTHYDHRGEVARRKSSDMIRHWIATHRADAAVIVTGDFNTLPDSEPYRRMITNEAGLHLSDARLSVDNPIGPESTWNGFEKIRPGRRIDFIFTAGPVAVESFRTLAEQRDGRFASDHLAIVAEVELAKGEG